jgi:hypothetical protein
LNFGLFFPRPEHPGQVPLKYFVEHSKAQVLLRLQVVAKRAANTFQIVSDNVRLPHLEIVKLLFVHQESSLDQQQCSPIFLF